MNRHQKNIATAIRTFLGQDADVGNEKEAGLPYRGNYLALDRVPAARRQEKEAALAPTINRFAQMLGKIERGIVRFPFVFQSDRLVLEGNARDVFLIEDSRVLKPRMLKFALGLANEMVDLIGGDARDFIFDCRQTAGTD